MIKCIWDEYNNSSSQEHTNPAFSTENDFGDMFNASNLGSGYNKNFSETQAFFLSVGLPLLLVASQALLVTGKYLYNKIINTDMFGKVVVKNGVVSINRFDMVSFREKIKKSFKDNNIMKIFDIIYGKFENFLYKHKWIARKQDMVMKRLEFKVFFAMEIVNLLNDLAERYDHKPYKRLARIIIDNTYLKNIGIAPYKVSMTPETENRLNVSLLKYQKEFIENYDYLKKALSLRGIILSFDQGLGKTLTALALSEHLDKKQVIVVCPNTLKNVWAMEIVDKLKVYSTAKDNRHLKVSAIYVEGDRSGRFNEYNSEQNKYLIVNNESIPKIIPKVDVSKDTIIIIDECHNFRYLDGSRLNALLELVDTIASKAKVDILPMSGTPIKAKPSEIVPALMMVDPLFDIECAKIYSSCFDVDTVEASRIIQQRFSYIIYRRLKSQVLDLPDKHEDTIRFTIPEDQKYTIEAVDKEIKDLFKIKYDENYNKVIPYAQKYTELVERYSRASSKLTKSYLKYVNKKVIQEKEQLIHELDMSEFMTFGDKYVRPYIKDKEILKEFNLCEAKYVQLYQSAMGLAIGEILPKRRAQMFIDIIDNNEEYFVNKIKSHEKKVCLFSSSKLVIKRLEKLMKDYDIGCVVITGDNVNERAKLIQKFKEDEMTKVIIASNTVIGVGVTLIESNLMYVFGTPWRRSDLNQLSDRIHRIGQKDDCYIKIIGLETTRKNLFDRMYDILNWSGKMTDSYIENIQNMTSDY